MARLGKVVEYLRESNTSATVRVALDASDEITATHYSAPGDDSAPLPGDWAVVIQDEKEWLCPGFVDAVEGSAQGGERRLYSRKSDGALAVVVYLKSDGTIEAGGALAVAIAEKVATELDRIKTDLSTLITAIGTGFTAVGVSTAANGPAGKTAFEGALGGVPSSPGDTASNTLKAGAP